MILLFVSGLAARGAMHWTADVFDGSPIPAWVLQGGIGTLLVIAVMTGLLVPRYLYLQMRKDLLGWKETAETAIAANKINAEQTDRLAATVDKLIEAQRDTEQLVRTLIATTSASARRESV